MSHKRGDGLRVCACGNQKHPNAVRCGPCYRRRWTDAEEGHLREAVAAGWEYRKIGKLLGRSEYACRCRAMSLGIKLSREAILANRKAGRDRFWKNPKRVARWVSKISKQYTPLDRKIRAEELRQRNLEGKMMRGRHHSPEARARIAAANRGRVFTAEHKAKIAEGRRLYWERWRALKRKGVEDVRAAMLADKRRLTACGMWGEVQPLEADLIWCAQCEKRVSAPQASACASPFCKARQAAA